MSVMSLTAPGRRSLATVGLASTLLCQCTNENHPPRRAAEATGVFTDLMKNEDSSDYLNGDCAREGVEGFTGVSFSFRFVHQIAPGISTTMFLRAEDPPGPHQAAVVPVTGYIDPSDSDLCERAVSGTIRFEYGTDVAPPPGATIAGPFAPTIIHGLVLPEQPLFEDLILCGAVTPTGETLPESRLMDARFYCFDSAAQIEAAGTQ